MLRPVRVARPQHQHEGLVARLEHRQHGLGHHVGEVLLLIDVGDGGAGFIGIAGLAVLAARGCFHRQIGGFESFLDLVGKRDAEILAVLRRAGLVVDDDRLRAAAFGVIEHQGRAELADGGGGETGAPGGREDRFLVEIVATEMVVDVAEHRIVLQERRHRSMRGADWIAGIDGVAVDAGVAEIMAGRHPRGVRHGEGRE